MSIIKDKDSNTVVTYNVTLEQMTEMISRDLGIDKDHIKVYYVIESVEDDGFYPSSKEVTKIKVVYNKN